jgi:hypothetical protein
MKQFFGLFIGRSEKASASPGRRLSLESLEDRVVPTMIDLTTAGASGTLGGAIFDQSITQPAGSGVFSAFVRIHGLGGATQEQGYNTDARPLQFDENQSPTFTRSLPLSAVPVLNVGGVNYRVFLLDINQKASAPLLSLDQLQIFVGASGNLTGYNTSSRQLAGLTAIYDLNPSGSGNWVELNGRLAQGLGKSDMALLVPDALFVSASASLGAASPDVYLFSRFGDHSSANGGFEQWGVQGQSGPAPSSLSGYVYVDINHTGSFVPGEGLAGVMMTLTGVDVNGHSVTLNAVTDANGFYYFDGLTAGTYTITKTPPAGYLDGNETVGSLGGVLGADLIAAISLGSGVNGFNYNFGELLHAAS